jgi:hypothetical protein
MTTRSKPLSLHGLLIFAVLILGVFLVYAIQAADAAPKTSKNNKTKTEIKPVACVSCHSFEALNARKASFKAEKGEIVNPHVYIPHNEKKPENVQECADCHTVHPIPLKEKVDLSKINLDSCYLSCHHQQNFERCNNCHKK